MKYNKLDIIAMALIYEGVTSKGGVINIHSERDFAMELINHAIQNKLMPKANLTNNTELNFRRLNPGENMTEEYAVRVLKDMLGSSIRNAVQKGMEPPDGYYDHFSRAHTGNVGKVWYGLYVSAD
jgi:hypothetical protein